MHNVLGDTAVQPNGPIPMGMFGYDPSVPKYDFNLTKTADYLKKALDPSNPTKSYAETGFTLKLYYNLGNTYRQAFMESLKRTLESLSQNASLGISGSISITVWPMDWPSYVNARTLHQLGLVPLGWNVDYPDPDDFANPFCHQYGTFPSMMAWGNATLTNMVVQAAHELNATLRTGLYSDISRACYDNAYYLWTDQPTDFHAERTWVSGYSYNPFRSGLNYYALDIQIDLPSVPRSVHALGGDGSVALNWSKPADPGSVGSAGWNIYRGANGRQEGPHGHTHRHQRAPSFRFWPGAS
ncbi:MAG: ABC transporter substrate-binding protein [Methanomassiliicoccales archaeon]|nr:ABC transporter substrate-binding protein [Methanomassiliicoccales archaeon]